MADETKERVERRDQCQLPNCSCQGQSETGRRERVDRGRVQVPRRMEVDSLVYGIVGCNKTGLWLSHKARQGEGAGRGWGVDGADDR